TASSVPLERGWNYIFGIEGRPPDKITYTEFRSIGPNYFETLGIKLRFGRQITNADADNGPPVVVVNATLAKIFRGGATALGQHIIIGRTTSEEDAVREIVGVVADVSDGRPGTRTFPTVYVPRNQLSDSYNGMNRSTTVLIRTSGNQAIASELRRII